MKLLTSFLDESDVLFVCQKGCLMSYKVFNSYQTILRDLSVVIVSDEADLHFTSALNKFKIVSLSLLQDELV